jgi:hypothetical protein
MIAWTLPGAKKRPDRTMGEDARSVLSRIR